MNGNDQEAARILSDWIHEHSPMILRTAYYYVKDRMVAEDIAQEVFLRAYRAMGDFRGEAGVRTWLYRITVNACKDHLRSWSHRRLVLMQTLKGQDAAESAELVAMRKIGESELAQKVMELPIRYREVIVLHYFEGFKSREIADLLDLKESTVRVRLSRGVAKLGQELKHPGEGGETAWTS